jgi:hypothetical protein
VVRLSSFVMSSQDAKLSSRASIELSLVVAMTELTLVVVAAELTLVVVAVELTAIVVVATQFVDVVAAVTQVAAVVVATTLVAAVVVATTKVTTVVVTTPNWKIQSLPHQTQCPSSAIGRDSQRYFHVSMHHSLQGISACFYSGQVVPCPQIL